MLYDTSGQTAPSRHLRRRLTITPDVTRRDHPYVNRFHLRHQICEVVLAAVLDNGSLDARIDYSVDVRLQAKFPPKTATIEAIVRIDVLFDPRDPERGTNVVPRSPKQNLRRTIDNEVGRVWGAFWLDQFVDDIQTAATCLHTVARRDGKWADEVLGALQQLEPVVLRHGYDLHDVVDLRTLRTSMPEEFPAALRAEGVLLVDNAGYVLAIEPQGRLRVARLDREDFDIGCAATEAAATETQQHQQLA